MGRLIVKTLGYGLATLYAVLILVVIFFSLPFTGWRALSVQTGSMVPAIRPGALIIVHQVDPKTLRIGDIITYASRETPHVSITHRITAFQYRGAVRDTIVKGDANSQPDRPVLQWQIMGKVVRSAPYLGRAVDILHRPIGLLFLVYLPALLLIVYELQLLIRRLTRMEVVKVAGHSPYGRFPSSRHPVFYTSRPKPTPADTFKRTTGFLVAFIIVALSTLAVRQTLAAMHITTRLQGNNVTAAVPTSPERVHDTGPGQLETNASGATSVNQTPQDMQASSSAMSAIQRAGR